MKILLLAINAKYIHTNPALYSLRQYAVHAAKEMGNFYREHIFLREYTINHAADVVLRGIYELRPQVLCISCYLWNIRMVEEIVADYKKIEPGVHIYLGGPEVSSSAEECLRRMPEADGVMVGEGEETFFELAKYYFEQEKRAHSEKEKGTSAKYDGRFEAARTEENADTAPVCFREGRPNPAEEKTEYSGAYPDARAQIRSLVYRGVDGRIQTNPLRAPLNFAELPFPYEECKNMENFVHKILYYETSRGCPFSCCYCLSSLEKTLRLRRLSLVEKELQFFLDCGVAQVKLVDRTFNCNKAHAMQIWRYLSEHDNGITNFHFEIAADLLDEEQIALLNTLRPGQVQLEIGVQSTNPRTIEAIRRRMDLKKVAQNVAQVRRARNIHQHLDLIAGLPYEDYASFGKSFDEVYRMRPDQLQLGFLKVLKGSAMADMTAEHRVVFKSEPPYEVLSTRYLSYADVLRLKDIEEMVEVYYNSGQYLSALPYLAAQSASPFAMFERLAAYYRKNGLFECRHSRMEQYEILYRFAQEEQKEMELEKISCFTECLLYDYYSRERPKAQPSFARAPGYEKGQLREVFAAFGVSKEHAGQCYAAHFNYDIEAAKEGRTRRCSMDCLFDYTRRDPLSGICKVGQRTFP